MRKLVFLLGIFAVAGLFMLGHSLKANAVFNPNRLIDDAVFDNANSMTAGQIDNWLNVNFPNSCISTNNGFSAADPTGYSPSTGFTYGGRVSSGQVIYDAGQAYGLNPQVLLATLEKEEGLVAGDGPYGCTPLAISASVGYGCPDSGSSYTYNNLSPPLYYLNGNPMSSVTNTCVNSASKAGFSQQLIRAAWLLKFGEQRSEGNTSWAVIKPGWDNSDDPQTCYGGPMTQGYRKRCSSDTNAVFYDGYTTIDGQSTHMDSGATAALYWYTPHFHGNQNFVSLFSQWFGDTTLPYAFKSSSNDNIYYYVDGFKVLVTAMGVLQDYGISPQSIQTLSQSQVDSVPSPGANDGVSPTLDYIVKSPDDTDADGGSIYLITVGKKYQFKSMQQFFDFGFSESNIGYLPLSFIQGLPGNSQLSNFVSSPYGSVFEMSGGQKKLIFDYQTYIGLNPSDIMTQASYYTVDLVPSGTPLSNRDILVKHPTGESVTLFLNGSYYSIPNFDVYSCWGFESSLNSPVYRLPDDSYVPSITPASALACEVNTGSATNLLSRSTRFAIPAGYGLSNPPVSNSDIIALSNKLPSSAAPLKQYIKFSNSAGIWYLNGGARKSVPTLSDYNLLGLNSSSFDVVDPSVQSSISTSGIKLGNGQAVKTDDSAAVYVVSGNSRLLYATSDDFLAYHNNWSDIESYPAATLNQDYSYSGTVVNKYLYDQNSDTVYLVDRFGCYSLDSNLLASYSKTKSGIQSAQTYSSSIFPKLGGCASGSVYIKQNDQPPVYLVSNGQKQVFSTWNALQNYSHSANPYIITLSASTMATFPNGAPIN